VKILSGLGYDRTWVVSAIAGAQTALFFTILAAWLLFPMLVGFRNTLDAGCAFMLISLGVVMVVGLAQNGPDYLLP
jgi:drug/metabolite transporter (DMT)-like permease